MKLFAKKYFYIILRMAQFKMAVKKPRGETSGSPTQQGKQKIPGLAIRSYINNLSNLGFDLKEVNYSKILENLSFWFFKQQKGLEDYTRHKHLPSYNEIVREFYAHLEPVMGNQVTHIIIRGKMFPNIM